MGAVTPPPPSAPSIISALTSHPHLTRERALVQFQTTLPVLPPPEQSDAKSLLLSHLTPTAPWYSLQGALTACTHTLQALPSDPSFEQTLLSHALPLVSHSEPRVRTAVSTLLGALAASAGLAIWTQVSPLLLAQVRTNLQRDESARLAEAADVARRELDDRAADTKLNKLKMVHETEGWRALETSMLALADVLKGCGQIVDVDKELHVCIVGAKDHPNRFVREAGLKLLHAVVQASNETTMHVVEYCLQALTEGLQDNWSQVRYAASVAARGTLEKLNDHDKRTLYEVLLPRMCLNRHYVAEGVRSLSRATWKEVVGADGRKFLSANVGIVLAYYEQQSRADNHAVREAACQGLAEVCEQLERSVVSPHVKRIIEILLGSFKDESWPVRDHACRALGGIAATFMEEAKESGRLSEVGTLFEKHLGDKIASVRRNCAIAFAMVTTEGGYNIGESVKIATKLMQRLKDQPEKVFGNKSLDSGYGAASKVARDNDVELHTGQVMYSCGSLAPKLRVGVEVGGGEPWEEAEGGVLFWKELKCEEGWTEVLDMGEVMVEKEFAQVMRLRKTWLECVGSVVQKESMANMERLVGVIEKCRKMENEGVRSAAAECARVVSRAIGLRGYAQARDSA